MQDQMLEAAEQFWQSLGVPYRVVTIVSAELNDAVRQTKFFPDCLPCHMFGWGGLAVACPTTHTLLHTTTTTA